VGTINDDHDKDVGFGAKLKIDWKLLGGRPQAGDHFRAHIRHHCKEGIKEAPFATVEDLEGENADYPEEWLDI
jgi:hypothetical protein